MRTCVLLLLLCLPQLRLDATIAVNSGVSVNGNTSDQVAWKDASGLTRSASIVQLNGASTAGKVGGYLTQVVYNDGAGNVTCNESGYGVDGTLSGLGQMVNHGGTGNGWVSSNQDGIKAGATTQVLFQGANHVIYQVDMDEYGDNGDASKGTWHDRWIYMFSTGHDYFLESISYDFSSHIAGYWGYAGVSGQTAHDSRSPYCSFNWSGTGAANTLTESIDGVEWAARDSGSNSYIFKTIGSSPFSSGYTYNAPASNIPYTLQWKNAPDREIGYVSTFDLTQFAAGEGFTSQCAIGSSAASMPANWGVNYQANGFQGWMGDKMTWGVPYGSAGGTTGGSTFPDWTYARNWTGYPTMGYTLQIQLGKHTADGVHKQVAEQAAIHALPSNALTAAVGTVVTTGKMNLQDPTSTFTFKPQGFNHIYNSWQVSCAGNAADVTLALGAASLKNPTFIFDNYNLGSLCQLTLNGTTQVEGTDIYTSLDTVNKKLYVTFNANFTGSEHIVIAASCATATPTPTPTPTNTACGACTNTFTPTLTLTPSGSTKNYCVHLDYAAVSPLVNDRKITLKVDVGTCTGVSVVAGGSAIPAAYSGSTAVFSTTATDIVISALGWTAGGTGAVTKAPLYADHHWAHSLTFDDGLHSPLDNAKPLLDAKGWRAGVALVGSILGVGGYFSLAEAQGLRAAGWDILNHSYTHPTLTCANFATEFGNNQTYFQANFPGYNVSHVVYPYEDISASACGTFPPAFVLSGEGQGSGVNFVDASYAGSAYKHFSRGGLYGTSATAWNSQVASTAANARPGWIIMITHEVFAGSTAPSGGLGPYSTNANTLSAYLNYMDANYGASGDNSLWFAPAGEVYDYLQTRDNVVLSTPACGTPTPTPTFCGACTSTFTSTSTLTPTQTNTATPPPACSGGTVDNLDDGNTQNQYLGYWYTYNGGGASTVNPSTFAPTAPGYGGSGYCARAYGNAVPAAPPSLGTSLGSPSTDASSYSGVSFRFKGDGAQYRFQIHSVVDPSYNDYQYVFTPPVGWSTVVIPWASFSPAGWGTPYTMDTQQLLGLTWVAVGNGAYDFSVDDVSFTCPTATPTRTATAAAGSATSTSTATVSSTSSSTRTQTPSVTPSRTATLSSTRTSSVSPSSTVTVSATPSISATFSASPSSTATETDVPPGSTLTNTPLSTSTRTSTPSGTSTPTSSATPSSTLTPTSTSSATISATASSTSTPLPGSPTFTASSTVSPSSTATNTTVSTPVVTPSATVSATATPTSTVTTAAPAATFTSTDTRTMTPTYTSTLVVVIGTATSTPVNSATASSGNGPLEVLQVLPCPNPNPGQIAVLLSGPADDVEIRLFSVAETAIGVLHSGPVPAGWSQVALPASTFTAYPNGLFYVRAQARQGERRSLPSKPMRMVVLR